MIETLWEVFHSKELACNVQKLNPYESGIMDRFAFVSWYMDEEVSMESAGEA